VAQILRWRIAGLAAWWLWRGVYWSKLPGIRCKLRVALDWTLDLVFPRDITKVALDRTQQLDRAHFRAGDTIIRQGEIGDRFYVIESGDVEVLRDQPGRPQERVAVRGAGESFGEIALVRDSLRTATVRCLTPVDVVSFTRRDFQTLLASSRQFRAQIESDVVGRGET
jgi:NADH dehydrogenase